MNTSISRLPYKRVWQQFYEAALFELDANKVPDRIAEAEAALVTRARELFHAAGDHIEEELSGVKHSFRSTTIRIPDLV
jgi:hypothetical protein